MVLDNRETFYNKIVDNLMKLPALQRRSAVREFHPAAQDRINLGLAERLVADMRNKGYNV